MTTIDQKLIEELASATSINADQAKEVISKLIEFNVIEPASTFRDEFVTRPSVHENFMFHRDPNSSLGVLTTKVSLMVQTDPEEVDPSERDEASSWTAGTINDESGLFDDPHAYEDALWSALGK